MALFLFKDITSAVSIGMTSFQFYRCLNFLFLRWSTTRLLHFVSFVARFPLPAGVNIEIATLRFFRCQNRLILAWSGIGTGGIGAIPMLAVPISGDFDIDTEATTQSRCPLLKYPEILASIGGARFVSVACIAPVQRKSL